MVLKITKLKNEVALIANGLASLRKNNLRTYELFRGEKNTIFAKIRAYELLEPLQYVKMYDSLVTNQTQHCEKLNFQDHIA